MTNFSQPNQLDGNSLRELKHDIGNDLSVIKMGLEAIVSLRENPNEFAEIVGLMRINVDSLRDKVARLVNHSTTDGPDDRSDQSVTD